MSKQLRNLSSEIKTSKSYTGKFNPIKYPSFVLPQLKNTESIQGSLRQFLLPESTKTLRIPQSRSEQGSPRYEDIITKHCTFDNWSHSVKTSYKAMRIYEKVDELDIQKQYSVITSESLNSTPIPTKDRDKFKKIVITDEVNDKLVEVVTLPLNQETAKLEKLETLSLEDSRKQNKARSDAEKDKEIEKLKKELQGLKKIYKKFEEIYCNDTHCLKRKLESRKIKYKKLESEYSKALRKIELLNEKYKNSLEVINNYQLKHNEEVNLLQDKIKESNFESDEGNYVTEMLYSKTNPIKIEQFPNIVSLQEKTPETKVIN
ncbi:hypothetical protein SteCoe_18496 [Stentor coeruleus]|uniref:Uncharacterized protein n=1 Tax=Stentor coeruleus TaxID=5963 RepID=A0A1R2BWH6_9CILI|nr:hypothetical protein SteCoe_18496 [Stentor coeruleus]